MQWQPGLDRLRDQVSRLFWEVKPKSDGVVYNAAYYLLYTASSVYGSEWLRGGRTDFLNDLNLASV